MKSGPFVTGVLLLAAVPGCLGKTIDKAVDHAVEKAQQDVPRLVARSTDKALDRVDESVALWIKLGVAGVCGVITFWTGKKVHRHLRRRKTAKASGGAALYVSGEKVPPAP